MNRRANNSLPSHQSSSSLAERFGDFFNRKMEKIRSGLYSIRDKSLVIAHNLSSPFQSAYRKGYSVETALLKAKEDILRAFDNQNGVLLVLLDLSAAFDTVDHNILLSHLNNLRVTDVVLRWIRSYVSDCS